MIAKTWNPWRHFDYVLLACAVLLTVYGILMVYSATLADSPADAPFLSTFPGHQAIFAVLGLVLLIVATVVDARWIRAAGYPVYAINLLLLLAVAAIGARSHGAQRWINVGFFEFQPSELAKLLIIVTLAKFFSDNQDRLHQFRYVLFSLALVGVPVVLVYVQPDLGTALVLVAIWLGMAIMAGVRLVHLGLLGGALALAAPLAWQFMKDYQRNRLLIFLNPESDPSGEGYNMIQSRISVGSGGWLGQGFAHGTQSQLDFLKVQHTDFIFAVLGEELGFIGALGLFALFLILLFCLIRAASNQRDLFGRVFAAGVASMLLFQIFINVGMTIGLMPVTGIPLPLISYGSSNLLTTLMAFGLLQSLLTHSYKTAWDGYTSG
ncbi:MAG TPA: rod shape-determining protein RodA [Chloroflexota bacterium]|jgi:rod shape determining protein RodA|nr:rod shape-determining protein RodA [Chloroflexota bacterium]